MAETKKKVPEKDTRVDGLIAILKDDVVPAVAQINKIFAANLAKKIAALGCFLLIAGVVSAATIWQDVDNDEHGTFNAESDGTDVTLNVDNIAVEDITLSDDLAITDDLSVGGDLTVTGATALDGATTATNITMDTGSTLAAKTLTATSLDVTGASSLTNLTVDSGATVDLSGISVTWTNTGSVAIDGTTAYSGTVNVLVAGGTTSAVVVVDGLIKSVTGL